MLDELKEKGIAIRVASPKLVQEEVKIDLATLLTRETCLSLGAGFVQECDRRR